MRAPKFSVHDAKDASKFGIVFNEGSFTQTALRLSVALTDQQYIVSAVDTSLDKPYINKQIYL
jgi:hypothetical protein